MNFLDKIEKYILFIQISQKSEFMGRSYAYPVINFSSNDPPDMTWHKVFRNNEQVGDILVSFELVKV